MKRVLVTAGAGLIGQAVVRRLAEEGFQPVILDAREGASDRFAVRRVAGRSWDPAALDDALEGCSDVLHLEWSKSIRDTSAAPMVSHERNVTGSANLLDRCRQGGLGFFFASTCVYRGDHPTPSNEDAPRNGGSIYVAQKSYIDALTSAYAHSFGMRAASLRIFNAYGEGGRPYLIFNRAFDALAGGDELVLSGDGGQMRDFIHVDDVASAFVAAVRAPKTAHSVFNVGTGVGTTMCELVDLVGKVAGRQVPKKFGPAAPEEARYLIADTSRAQQDLGWKPEISLEEGIRRLAAARLD